MDKIAVVLLKGPSNVEEWAESIETCLVYYEAEDALKIDILLTPKAAIDDTPAETADAFNKRLEKYKRV